MASPLRIHGLILLIALITTLPGGAAEPGAKAAPAVVHPGETILLAFTFGGSAVAEITLLESVSCTITPPDGDEIACDAASTLVDVRAQGAERTFVYALQAPDVLGRYTATMTRTAPVDVTLPPASAAELQTTFDVIPEPVQPNVAPDASVTPPPTTPATTPAEPPPSEILPTGGKGPAAGANAWLATLGMAALAMLAAAGVVWRGR